MKTYPPRRYLPPISNVTTRDNTCEASSAILAGFRSSYGLDPDRGRTPVLRATIVAMPPRARVITWNGKDIRPELLELPAGRYVVDPVGEEPFVLTLEEEAGIEAALDSFASLIPNAPGRSSTQLSVVEGNLHRRCGRRHRPHDYLSQRSNSTATAKLDADIAPAAARRRRSNRASFAACLDRED